MINSDAIPWLTGLPQDTLKATTNMPENSYYFNLKKAEFLVPHLQNFELYKFKTLTFCHRTSTLASQELQCFDSVMSTSNEKVGYGCNCAAGGTLKQIIFTANMMAKRL